MKLILVYNADDGMFNAITDTIHKVMSPETYECRLCQFTYGMVGMLKKWKNFLETISFKKEFLHRNEFKSAYPDRNEDLPAIFIANDENKLELLVSADEMNGCDDLDALIEFTQERLSLRSLN